MAWIITKDKIATPGAEPRTNQNAVGITGPSTASDHAVARLREGDGQPFRMLDGDGEIYYYGRFLEEPHDPELYEAVEFQPLDNFGTPNAGCAEIQYKSELGIWEIL
jgi:hypothetical protein